MPGPASPATPRPQQRSTALFAPIDPNSPLRHPLTVLVCLLPLGLIAELYRWLAGSQQRLLADEALQQLGGSLGADRPVLTLCLLGLGCLTVQVARRLPWHWPTLATLGQVLGWALVWAMVRAVIGITGEAVLLDQAGGFDPLVDRPGEELSLLGHVGLSVTGALQEELIFRAGLVGCLGLMLCAFGLRLVQGQVIVLLPAAVAFALAHTELVNHYSSALPFTWPLFIQHALAGLLYGVVFIRQGLAVCTLSHACYNGAVAFGLLDF
jgi:hypothetical protein